MCAHSGILWIAGEWYGHTRNIPQRTFARHTTHPQSTRCHARVASCGELLCVVCCEWYPVSDVLCVVSCAWCVVLCMSRRTSMLDGVLCMVCCAQHTCGEANTVCCDVLCCVCLGEQVCWMVCCAWSVVHTTRVVRQTLYVVMSCAVYV